MPTYEFQQLNEINLSLVSEINLQDPKILSSNEEIFKKIRADSQKLKKDYQELKLQEIGGMKKTSNIDLELRLNLSYGLRIMAGQIIKSYVHLWEFHDVPEKLTLALDSISQLTQIANLYINQVIF